MSTIALPTRLLAANFARDRIALLSFWLLAALLFCALAAPWLAPQNPYDLAQLDILDAKLAPGVKSSAGSTYWLGTDDQGRDMLSAILYGLRISLGVGITSTVLALALGVISGMTAARAGGWIDGLIMRIVDLQLSFPAILVALILLALTGQGIDRIILALVVVQWAYYARTVRAAALVELRKEYVEAAVCMGIGEARILLRHVLPNVLPPVMVVATVQIAQAIALEATLSFLGLGLPITEPSLGLLIANGYAHLLSGKYWISFFPGLALLVTIVAINLVGDRLRDLLNPRLR
ncbi:MAG: Glutathione transport system permease protein GsiD [Pseudomonadota bacterium]|jgi:peptide/nickel transport system permease protein